ncbi:MAG: hypothetical protein ACE14T_05060 [Syntrophales bacterium]
MKIVPALLSEKFEDFAVRLKQAESFADYVQVDIMDGLFVPTKSFPPGELNRIETSLPFEIHMMVDDPITCLNQVRNRRLKRAIFHFESKAAFPDFLDAAKKRGVEPGMAINPRTEFCDFEKAAEQIPALTFLTVEPGRYGSPFRPEVLKKISETRAAFPDKVISVDGGVSLDNLQDFLEIGVDYVCIGSRIFLKGRPEENYRMFVARLSELEALAARSRKA